MLISRPERAYAQTGKYSCPNGQSHTPETGSLIRPNGQPHTPQTGSLIRPNGQMYI